MSNWLSRKWDEITGANQEVDIGTVESEYDTAFGTFNPETGKGTGAMGAYSNLQQTGEQMMDANSRLNLNRKSQMEASAADASAEGARQAQRLAAMGGGGNTASLTAQTMESGNKAQAGAVGAFNQYLAGAMGQGAGLVSQSANNMAQMNQTKMNAISNQRLANSRLQSQATGMGAQMLGSVLGNVVAPGIGGKIGKGIGQLFAQEGDYVDQVDSYMQDGGPVESPYGNSGGMLSQVMGPDGIPMQVRTRIGGQYVG